MQLFELYDTCNDTELYQIARSLGIEVPPTTSREDLIAFILHEREPPLFTNAVDDWRRAIMEFVNEYWKVLCTQVTCPAKSRDPRACFGCVDTQVISCLVKAGPNLHKIEKHFHHTSRENQTIMTIARMTPATAFEKFQTIEQLATLNKLQQRLLMQDCGGLTEQVLMAWQKLQNPLACAQVVFPMLQEWGRRNSGAPPQPSIMSPPPAVAQAAAVVGTPGGTPVTVAPVHPQALQTAAQAVGAVTPPQRSPRTPKSAPASAAPQANGAGPYPTGIPGGPPTSLPFPPTAPVDFGPVLQQISGIASRLTAIEQKLATNQQESSNDTFRLLVLLLNLLEVQFGMSKAEILEMAAGDAAALKGMLTPGK